MKRIRIFAQLVLLALLAGCTALQSEFYPGERIENLHGILPEESIWVANDNAVLHIRTDGTNGLVLAGLEWDSKDGAYKAESMTIVLSKLDEQYFASFKEDDDPYIITRLLLPGIDDGRPNSAVILNIDPDKLKRDAAAGTVALQKKERNGKEEFETILTGTKAKQDEYFRSNPNSLWDLESASVIRRIAP